MNRRSFVQMGLAPALAAQAPPTARPKTSRPNILFLMADQLRADCVGMLRQPRNPNPESRSPGARRSHVHKRVLLCAELHARAVGAADGTVAMASRDARHDAHGRELSA